jgi:hypothetical protein
MNDIVERLRDHALAAMVEGRLMTEAADEIERLRWADGANRDDAAQALAEIERLRDVLRTIAAQDSGKIASTALSDCMAALARAALGEAQS